jgi:phage baseplate assembly protein W
VTGDFLDHPFAVDARGRSATVGEDQHVRDLIEQVLFTSPGERVNRPEFGCGLKSLVFMPNSTALAAATHALVRGALQKWLEREIQVEEVEIEARDERLEVTVAYRRRAGGDRQVESFGLPKGTL